MKKIKQQMDKLQKADYDCGGFVLTLVFNAVTPYGH